MRDVMIILSFLLGSFFGAISLLIYTMSLNPEGQFISKIYTHAAPLLPWTMSLFIACIASIVVLTYTRSDREKARIEKRVRRYFNKTK